MDWETYEHEDVRDRKRRSAASRVRTEPWRPYVPLVLAGLYPHVVTHPLRYENDPDVIIPGALAHRLSLDPSMVGQALSHLASDGFVQGPFDLPKCEEDGSPVRYAIGRGVQAEWDGSRWVTALDWFGRTVRKRDGSVWRNPPRRVVQRAVRKAERARRPVDFDGRGFKVLRDSVPYREYGEARGFFSERGALEPVRPPPPEICRRCGSVVGYRTRHGKRRRDHGLRRCNAELVRHIMEE